MRWYYSSDDDSSKRGLVEQEVLFEMARKGELKSTDLVWQEDSEAGWVIASSIEGLFAGQQPVIKPPAPDSKRQLRTKTAADAAASAAPAPPTKKASKGQKKLTKILALLSILALLMTAAVVATVMKEIKRTNEIPPEPVVTGPPPEVVRSNRVAALARQIDVFLKREDVARSEGLLAEMRKNDDSGKTTAVYAGRIGALKAELARFAEMQNILRNGKLTKELIPELVKVYEKRGGNKELLVFAEAIAADKPNLTPDISLSLIRLFSALKEPARLNKSLLAFSGIAPTNGPAAAHLEVVQTYCALNQPTNAMTLLQKYLAGVPTNSVAWYELAAIRCSTGHKDESMEALKEAVKFGDEGTKRSAAADPRFGSISDWWSFKRLTKIKE